MFYSLRKTEQNLSALLHHKTNRRRSRLRTKFKLWIITKGHGGEMKVETREGEEAEFINQLP